MANGEWTGGRLDDLNRRVDAGFSRVDADLRAMRSESVALRKEVNASLAKMQRETNERLEAMQRETNERFEAMHRLILQAGGGIIATLAIGFLSVVVTQL